MNLVNATILVVTIFCIVIAKVAGESETTAAAAVPKVFIL